MSFSFIPLRYRLSTDLVPNYYNVTLWPHLSREANTGLYIFTGDCRASFFQHISCSCTDFNLGNVTAGRETIYLFISSMNHFIQNTCKTIEEIFGVAQYNCNVPYVCEPNTDGLRRKHSNCFVWGRICHIHTFGFVDNFSHHCCTDGFSCIFHCP